MITININKEDNRQIVVICGDLDNAASSYAENALAPLWEQKDCDIALDCSALDYISSSGLRILLNIYKHCRANGHQAILINPSEDVHEIFDTAGFLQLFKEEKR